MKRKRKKKIRHKSCYGCECCLPIGEGDHLCDQIMELVMVDYEPTEYFGGCVKNKGVCKNGSNA